MKRILLFLFLVPTIALAGWRPAGTPFSGGGGGYVAYSGGTYPSGTITTVGACPWLFAATSSTSAKPCYDLGNLGASATWKAQGAAPSQDSINGILTLIAAVNGQAASGLYLTNIAGWSDKVIAVDAVVNGTADALGIGLYDGAATTTFSSSINGLAGAYGIELDVFNSKVCPIVNGTSVTGSCQVVGSGSIQTTSQTGPDRWFVSFHDTGSAMNVTVYRSIYWDNSTCGGCVLNPTSKQVRTFAQFIGVAKPSYTNWKPIVSARTGGSNGTSKVTGAWVRDSISGWKVIGALTDRQ